MLPLDECIRTGSTTDLFTRLDANLLIDYLSYYTSASAEGNNKDILLVVEFNYKLKYK